MHHTAFRCLLPTLLLAAFAASAVAQSGGFLAQHSMLDTSPPRQELFARPTNPASSTTGINPAAQQAVAARAAVQPTPLPTAAITPAAKSALDYFGGQAARQTLSQIPQPRRFVSQGGTPVGTGTSAKPYAGAQPDPTVSPYLNLFREETEDELPNYFTYVRPYQQQIETNRKQQQRLQTLQRQVQRTAYQTPAGGALPPTGTRARFGDTGQFYGGWKR